jgi:glycosyltransferase involved in cell wall biosynthesis
MNPLVSIGVPVKNGFWNKTEKDINLEKVIHSILNQSYANLEIIISNNGSTDKTDFFLEKISKNDNRIKIYNQTPEIPGGQNFVFVLSKATGKYFKWNCADDLLSHDFVEKNVDFLEKNLDYSFSSSKFFFENKRSDIYFNNLNQDLYNRIKFFFNLRYQSHNLFYGLIRKDHCSKITYMGKDYLGGDWMSSLDLLTKGKFKTINDGHIVLGLGISKSKNFLSHYMHTAKAIYWILPFYEFTKDFYKLIFFSKGLSYFQKITLYLICIKVNLSFAIRKLKIKFTNE